MENHGFAKGDLSGDSKWIFNLDVLDAGDFPIQNWKLLVCMILLEPNTVDPVYIYIIHMYIVYYVHTHTLYIYTYTYTVLRSEICSFIRY